MKFVETQQFSVNPQFIRGQRVNVNCTDESEEDLN